MVACKGRSKRRDSVKLQGLRTHEGLARIQVSRNQKSLASRRYTFLSAVLVFITCTMPVGLGESGLYNQTDIHRQRDETDSIRPGSAMIVSLDTFRVVDGVAVTNTYSVPFLG
ncbi:transcription initiation factor iif subunit beta [Moniliophthora roreri]|nr:transcription initiation factor iif subunit beta [Moniliophthora roreri]